VIARLDDEFDDVVRRSFGTQRTTRSAGFVPAVDMGMDGTDVVITLELPGLDADDVDLQVHQGRLTITGERRDTSEKVHGVTARAGCSCASCGTAPSAASSRCPRASAPTT
jgi:HSP20 family protein